jgi:hypothetical protein
MAANEAARVARKRSAVEIETGADLVPDDHRELATGVEPFDVVGAGGMIDEPEREDRCDTETPQGS